MRKYIIFIFFILSISYSYSIDTLKTKELSIGLKLGVPNFLVGLSVEFGRFNNEHLSVITDVSYLPEFRLDKELYFKSQNYLIGVNYYFLKNRNLFIGFGIGYLKSEYINKHEDLFYDNNYNKLDADLIYTKEMFYLKPSIGYTFNLGKFYLTPELEYYISNYEYSENNWKYYLENGEVRGGNELLKVELESSTLCLTIGYKINFK